MKKTLNIGAGSRTYKTYPTNNYECINFDERVLENIDEIGDVRDLSRFKDEEFDFILASDIIEHFPIAETNKILTEWVRVLKSNCLIEFRLPNLPAILVEYANKRNARHTSWLLYGGQDYPGNFHYVCYDRNLLKEECNKVGLQEITYSEEGFNMIVRYRRITNEES